MNDLPVNRYRSAGGVVIQADRVLVLERPSLGEVRLPKGHIEPGETIQQAALRETLEESGYEGLQILEDLGSQLVTFDLPHERVIRREFYFLMALVDPLARGPGEAQFKPAWVTWQAALEMLTFEAERNWIERARLAVQQGGYAGRGGPD